MIVASVELTRDSRHEYEVELESLKQERAIYSPQTGCSPYYILLREPSY
jgi:hypothetical protein